MTDEQTREIKIGLIALLTVAIQIRDGNKDRSGDSHITAAQNLLTSVTRVLKDDE
jgi:hypothetical protein